MILFYQNLYSGLGYSFNSEVNKVNLSILSKDYNKAFSLLNLIEKKQLLRAVITGGKAYYGSIAGSIIF